MAEENKEDVKLVDDFDGTPAIELTDSDAILEKKIMDIYNLELDVKLAIIRRIEDARHNANIIQDVNPGKPYDFGFPNVVYTNASKVTKVNPLDLKVDTSATPYLGPNYYSNSYSNSLCSNK